MKHLLTSNAQLLPVPLLLWIILLLLFQINLTITLTRVEGTEFQACSYAYLNYTSGSQYESNLINNLFPLLVSNGPRTGFLTASFGADPDIVYGLAQCRGDISPEECQTCLNAASVKTIEKCPNKLTATRRDDNCLLRYSYFNFSTQFDNYKEQFANTANVTDADPDTFKKQLGALMKNLTSKAISEPSRFETGTMPYNDFRNIYGLVQCTQDLSSTSCSECFQGLLDGLRTCCSGRQGGRVDGRSCYVRFELYKFFGQRLQLPSPPLSMSPQPNDGKNTKSSTSSSPNIHVAIIVVPIIIGSLLLLSVAVCVYLAKRRRKREQTTGMDQIQTAESLQFDLATIINATNNFSDANKLGEGGFGDVYKGELPNGEEIAVKRLSSKSGQGSQEFKNEVVLLHKLQHRNLVRLLGFCLEGEEKILIYEFLPNTSLDKYLFDPLKRTSLDWQRRYKIVGGIARGLLYLHEDSRLRIIHRDLKAGNILLDEEMTAKIADFGMAKLFEVDQTHGNTSRIAGTFGYMAPEYALHGQFSVKSDVFSFGVLLLEIVSGQKVNSFYLSASSENLLSYAWKHWRQDTALELMDPALTDSYARAEVMRCIHIGLLCVQDNIEERPTMSSVVLMLNSYSLTLSTPSQPAFFASSRTHSTELGRRDQENDQHSGNYRSMDDTITMPR